MYQIYADESLVYDSTLEDYPITKGNIEQEVNKSGSFVFAMPPGNPFASQITKMKTIIRVIKNSERIFRGRVLTFSDSFNKTRIFTCEGELSFLLDSVVRPYSFSGSPSDLFRQLIENHNSQVDEAKQFIIGQITVEDKNDYVVRSNGTATKTLDEIKKKLVETLGGYLYITYDDAGKSVLNWLADFPYLSRQKIEFGENMLDFVKTDSADEVSTAMIPYGAKLGETGSSTMEDSAAESDTRLTIESVNEGKDYVFSTLGVAAFGWIYTTETWDDITLPENLKTAAQKRIDELAKSKVKIELKAVDLSAMDQNIDHFRLGDYIQIVSAPHNIDEKILLCKLSRDLLNEANDSIVLGYEAASFIGDGIKNDQMITDTVTNIIKDYVVNEAIKNIEKNMSTMIQQTSETIMSTVSKIETDTDQVISQIQTSLTQLNDSFQFDFTQMRTEIGNAQQEYRDEFTVWKKYIRFEDGNIVLGKSGSEITLKIENDIIAFYEDGTQIAYFRDHKMHVRDGEFENMLRIGNYAFVPRKNGNLSFMKVKEQE